MLACLLKAEYSSTVHLPFEELLSLKQLEETRGLIGLVGLCGLVLRPSLQVLLHKKKTEKTAQLLLLTALVGLWNLQV